MVSAAGSAPGPSQLLVLSKITDILDAFTLEAPALTLTQIREATGLPVSTTQRLVVNLVAQGFLDRDGDRFRIGLRMAYWAAPAVRGIRAVDVVAPLLQELRDATGETASLFRSEEDYRVCIGLEETHHELRQDSYVGKVAPLTVGSAGRVLLAWNDELRAQVLGRPIPDLAHRTITDPAALAEALAETARRGYAITGNERVDGLTGVAAPVFDPDGRVRMAISVSGPVARISPDDLDRWTPLVREAADQATRRLGGRAPASVS
ncbi:IclR family transcriptional regulator [Rathayibacter sp. VKM Ac-2835]|uniref:IclR family transcriptional regulator n=1 Tax=Rathayibacter sp. VKM Ac-2835 TaxID=2739043 RepID=UPI0015650C03|nr:IclR family transcriptional regulator [Rathayibacter sp. VKM Ac-2835]NRG42294.1 IclR family transcriptional regulator [Rathayibacter sp. VKM Ac-2835]